MEIGLDMRIIAFAGGLKYDGKMKLSPGRWTEGNYAALRRFLAEVRAPALAVFDWDNTCICGDVGETFFRQQVFSLAFRLDAPALETLLPERVNGCDAVTLAGGSFSLAELKADILESFRSLERAGLALERCGSLAAYRRFVFDMLLLNEGLERTPGIGPEFAYVWQARLLAGFAAEELSTLAEDLTWQELHRPLADHTLSDDRRGISLHWRDGLRPYPEMGNLAAAVEERGGRVAVVTASQPLIVAAMVEALDFPLDALIGMELRSEDGRLTAELDSRYAVNFGEGKVANILAAFGIEPLLVAGDSNSDAAMLSRFPATRVRLIIDRGLSGEIETLVQKARAGECGYLLQPIDAETGQFAYPENARRKRQAP